MTGLNTEPKVLGREQDSRETERECVGKRQSIAENERWRGK